MQEQLEAGSGIGAVISPRDLAMDNAVEYASAYRELGADVLIDQQFYVPDFTNSKLETYAISEHRAAVSTLHQIGEPALDRLSTQLDQVSRDLAVSAVVAPAVIYEAGRPDIERINAKLFRASKRVGDALGLPTYATAVLGRSVTGANQTLGPALSQVTALGADGWYFGFEFEPERIPSDRAAIERAARAMLTLAGTGRPVLHAYAGPLALLSFGFGAAGVGIGHSQNTWRFTPDRWAPSAGGGGGDAPARFWSTRLWGTVVYPDETVRLPASVASAVLTHSPFSSPVAQNPPQPWSRWDANKHLVYLQAEVAGQLAQHSDPRDAAREAMQVLTNAVTLHGQIGANGIQLADSTSAYQANWLGAVNSVIVDSAGDYDFLDLIRS